MQKMFSYLVFLIVFLHLKSIEKFLKKVFFCKKNRNDYIKNLISSGFDFDKAVEVLKIPADQIMELRLLVLDNGTI